MKALQQNAFLLSEVSWLTQIFSKIKGFDMVVVGDS